MPDFDTNEDPIRVTGAGKDEPIDPAEARRHVMPRARELAYGQCFARPGRSRLGVEETLPALHRRAGRLACPRARRVALLGTPPRLRRRLWTMCHGRPPGFPS